MVVSWDQIGKILGFRKLLFGRYMGRNDKLVLVSITIRC
jgi:hypothetical protein